MQKATKILVGEQESLIGLMDSVDEVALLLKVGTTVRRRRFLEFNEAIQLVLKACHYRKEKLLYDVLEKNGVLRHDGILGIFEREIKVCHSLLDKMIVAAKAYAEGDDAAGLTWAEKADFFANIYRVHARRENEVLFPLVEEVLGDHDQKQLSIAFGETDRHAQELKRTLIKIQDGFGRIVNLDRVKDLL